MSARATVLLVDDNVGMVETLADILSTRGHDVTTAHSGDAALVMIRASRYDVALMDIRMPGLDGVEALKHVRALDPRMRVIMMTAYTRDELADEARRAGAVDVLPKPLDIERVFALVETLDVGRMPGSPS